MVHLWLGASFSETGWACFLKWGAYHYGITSITVAEARAMRDGIYRAIQDGFQSIVVEGDNKSIIQVAQGVTKVPWRIHHLLQDLQAWKEAGIQLSFNHMYREANRAADWVTNFGHTITHPLITETCFSPELQTIIREDVVGHSFVRKDV